MKLTIHNKLVILNIYIYKYIYIYILYYYLLLNLYGLLLCIFFYIYYGLATFIMRAFGLGWKWRCVFKLFFFPLRVNIKIIWFYCTGTKNTVHALFTYCSCTVLGSHNTIHIFKNYFTTVFSVFSFSNNKFNPNGPYILYIIYLYFLCMKRGGMNHVIKWLDLFLLHIGSVWIELIV